MDALTLGTFLSPILTITTVWNTGETGDINTTLLVGIDKIAQISYGEFGDMYEYSSFFFVHVMNKVLFSPFLTIRTHAQAAVP